MNRDRGIKATRQTKNKVLPAIENNAFNQTIIINNPNFNINYIENKHYNPDSKPTHDKMISENTQYEIKNSSKGVDAWSLNKNLKDFSETRQLGFFKPSNPKSSQIEKSSPYLQHRNRTQELRPYLKIAPNVQPQTFRQNKTISTIKKQTLNPIVQEIATNGRMNPEQPKTTFRKKKYESKPKIIVPRHQQLSERSIVPLEAYLKETIDSHRTIANETKYGASNSRKNKFYQNTDLIEPRSNFQIKYGTQQILEVSQHEKSYQNEEQIQNLEASLIETQGQSPTRRKANSTSKAFHPSRKIYEKSIAKISQSLLRRVDNYFDEMSSVSIPSSKIELYATTISQPSSLSHNTDLQQKSSPMQNWEYYDFQFEDEKSKKRPKTPYKRKKMYEQTI